LNVASDAEEAIPAGFLPFHRRPLPALLHCPPQLPAAAAHHAPLRLAEHAPLAAPTTETQNAPSSAPAAGFVPGGEMPILARELPGFRVWCRGLRGYDPVIGEASPVPCGIAARVADSTPNPPP
jgi:hypothetical protein